MDKYKDNGITLVFYKSVKYLGEENIVNNPNINGDFSSLNIESQSNTK